MDAPKSSISLHSAPPAPVSSSARVGNVKSRDLIKDYNHRQTQQVRYALAKQRKHTDEHAEIVPLLALQVYHLPGNGWCRDWWQYMTNNHLIFGICCHHRLHPLKTCTRLVALLGSLLFGLLVTNIFHLLFLWFEELDQTVFTVMLGGPDEVATPDNSFTLTSGMLLLWTAGGGVHTAFNLAIWHLAACACCRAGGCCQSIGCCPSFGKKVIRVLVLVVLLMAVLIIPLRAAIDEQVQQQDEAMGAFNTTSNFTDSQSELGLSFDVPSLTDVAEVDQEIAKAGKAQDFNFLLGYLVEFVLAMFVYHPICGTILFSGVLGCGTMPLLGGRPREVALEKKKLEEEEKRKARMCFNCHGTVASKSTYKKTMAGGKSTTTPSTARTTGSLSLVTAEDQLETQRHFHSSPDPYDEGIEILWTPQALREFDQTRDVEQGSRPRK